MATVHFADGDFLVQRGRSSDGQEFTTWCWIRMPFAITRGTELLAVFHATSFVDACLRYAEASSQRLLWDDDLGELGAFTLDGVELTDGQEISQLGHFRGGAAGSLLSVDLAEDEPAEWLFFQVSTAPISS